jgi:hypothetical protein
MRPLVNLASEPFRNRRLFWLAIIAVFALSAFWGHRSIRTLSQIDAQLALREPAIRQLEATAKETEAKAPKDQVLSVEQSRAYWAANSLISRKLFSWTLLVNDIERLIPRGVRVTKVGVSKAAKQTPAGEIVRITVPLDMEVVAKSVDDITAMITAFNRTDVFVVSPKWQKPIEGTSDIEFGLEIAYQPPPLMPVPTVMPAKQAAQQIAERR